MTIGGGNVAKTKSMIVLDYFILVSYTSMMYQHLLTVLLVPCGPFLLNAYASMMPHGCLDPSNRFFFIAH